MHEVKTPVEREEMVSEMARVLKLGGHVALIDFIFTDHCVEILQKAGIPNAQRVRVGGFSSWIGTVLMLWADRDRELSTGREKRKMRGRAAEASLEGRDFDPVTM